MDKGDPSRRVCVTISSIDDDTRREKSESFAEAHFSPARGSSRWGRVPRNAVLAIEKGPMQISCSARLLQPFLRIAATSEIHRDLVPAAFWQVHPDSRVPLLEAHNMLERGAERSRDDHLGLKLGSNMSLGTAGVFDYVVRSAPTVRDSFAVISRYSRLLSDSF